MADNIKQIKVEGVSYDLNAKYIQDGSGNPKTWQNIADMINTGIQLVTDNARKEAAGDGAIGAPATTAAASTMGKIYLVANDGGISGTYVEFVTIDKGPDSTGAAGYVRYVWEKIGTTATDLTDYVKKGQITLSGTAATAGDTATGSAGAGAASNTGAGGAIDTTVSITDTAGAPTVTGSGGGATVTSAAAGAATITSTSAGAHTHSVTIAAHSHTVNVATATLSPVTAVGAATGSAGNHTHSITPSTATLTYVTGATLSAGGGATVNSSSAGSHSHSITPSTGTAASPASYADGILSLGSMTVVTGVSATGAAGAHTHSVTIAAHSHTVNVATGSKSVVTGVSATGAAGAHTHSVSATVGDTITYVTGATLSAAGAGTVATTSAGGHSHSVTIAAHSHSVTVGAHSHTITPTTNTFTYDLKVPDHSHSYTKPTAHTHSIAQHTHSVTVKGNNN